MMKSQFSIRVMARIAILFIFVLPVKLMAQTSPSLMLIDFENKYKLKQVAVTDAKPKMLTEGDNHLLSVTLGHTASKPSVKFTMEPRDLSGYLGIAIDVRNLNPYGISVGAQCSGSSGKQVNKSLLWLEPGESDILYITFYRAANSLPAYISEGLKGMNGLPGGYVKHWEIVDLKSVSNIDVYTVKPSKDCIISIDNIRAIGKYDLPSEEKMKSFLPFIDNFGQYVHSSWPGKISTKDEILRQKKEEQEDLKSNPGPAEWNKYGGWSNGPQLNATGHFRVEKHEGRWWLIDPDGRLFWSQGIDCVILTQNTPIANREKYFTSIPPNGDFRRANLLLKYGNVWEASPRDSTIAVIHQRLRSWGINTIANWSDAIVYEQKKTPYTATLSSGISKNMPSTLDEKEFRATCASRLSRGNIANTANDPWCIGYFVDNELTWPSNNGPEVIETYYRIVREELKKIAPNKLFLGSRIHNNNATALAIAAKYCDVVSINRYDYTVSDFSMPDGIDMPVIIGEFHFGALDRGLPHTGLRSVLNQKQRADIYRNFVNQAIESPIIVGAHWFQFSDQVYTGRNDGENYQIGFVDICDRPYSEIVAASRRIGSYLYSYRSTGTLAARPK